MPIGCTLAHMALRSTRIQLRFGDEDVAILREVGEALGLDASATFRTLLREKRRQLAREALAPVAKKRRRAARA